MYGLSNGENIFDLRWPLKVKVNPWKLWSQISQISEKRFEDREKVSIEIREIEVRKLRNNTFIPVYIHIHIQNQILKSNISKTVRLQRESVNGS